MAEQTGCEDARLEALQLEPTTSLATAQRLMGQTEDAHMLLAKFGGPAFGGLRSCDNALARAEAGSTLTPRQLLDIGENLRVIRSLSEWRSHNDLATRLDGFFNGLMPNVFLERQIFDSINFDEEISDSASPELRNIRRKMQALAAGIREKLDKMIRSEAYKKYLQDALVTQRNGRFVVPVKSEYRSEIHGLVHDTSSSGATVFIEPMAVVEANNEIKVLQSAELDEIERILSALSASAGEGAPMLKNSYRCAVSLNLIFAKARLAYEMRASVPLLNEEGIIDFKNARHPLLDKKSVVPTNICLGLGFDTLVITGPNTGGKTVSIKTVGLLSLMAACGLMLPVSDNSRACIFSSVFADIGDEQSIEQSLSTFSSHMVNIVDILSASDSKSLVLIDELGAGTDPVEGAALAMAILERLHEKGCKIAATTHYAELKAYALQTDRVENGCCEFSVETLRPTYKLLIGVPGRSNAFAISARLGLDEALIDRARALVDSENVRFEDVVDALEGRRLEMERARGEAMEALERARQARLEAEELRQQTQEQCKKETERARGEALRIVERTRREAAALSEEIDKLKKDAAKAPNETARRAKQLMRQGMAALDATADPIDDSAQFVKYALPRPLKIGDEVMIADLGTRATVLSLPDKGGNVSVQSGAARTRVKQDRLRLIESTKKQESSVTLRTKTESRASMEINTRCDIRGYNSEEGIMELDRFLDSVVMSGVKEFTVIHGKGTGVLRSAVAAHLRHHPQVKSFRVGTFGEGENGVTVVTLK